MTPCALNDQLDAYLDGDLAPRAARQFEAHAEACPACADELALARRLQGALRALPEEPCPYDVFQGALDRIAREAKGVQTSAHPVDRAALPSRARQDRARLPRWQVAAAAVALVLLGVLATALLRPAAAPVPGASVASTQQPDGPAPEVAPLPADEPPAADPVTAAATDSVSAPTPALPDSRPAPARRRAEPSTTAPAPAPTTAPRNDLAEAAPSRNRPSETAPEPTPEEVASAREGVHLAFSLFADANRQATEAVRTNVGQGIAHVTDAFTILR